MFLATTTILAGRRGGLGRRAVPRQWLEAPAGPGNAFDRIVGPDGGRLFGVQCRPGGAMTNGINDIECSAAPESGRGADPRDSLNTEI
jgi:hypothetical protein